MPCTTSLFLMISHVYLSLHTHAKNILISHVAGPEILPPNTTYLQVIVICFVRAFVSVMYFQRRVNDV
jgi:hypothetical protein